MDILEKIKNQIGNDVFVLIIHNCKKCIVTLKLVNFKIGELHDTLLFKDGSIYTIWDKDYNEHFGKSIFFTREEAEKSLSKGEKR